MIYSMNMALLYRQLLHGCFLMGTGQQMFLLPVKVTMFFGCRRCG